MATKWKKSKCAVSFLCFVLGVSLLLISCMGALSLLRRGDWSMAADALKSDYQDTARFQNIMEGRLNRCLTWAYGGNRNEEELDRLFAGRNLLYQVTVQTGRTSVTASNYDGLTAANEYSFRLSFDGGTVTIEKDGKESDL